MFDQFFVSTEVTRMTWLAYPRLPPTGPWPGFRLAPGPYYTGAMEYAVSTMETQAIAGVATANLVIRHNHPRAPPAAV